MFIVICPFPFADDAGDVSNQTEILDERSILITRCISGEESFISISQCSFQTPLAYKACVMKILVIFLFGIAQLVLYQPGQQTELIAVIAGSKHSTPIDQTQ